MFSLPLGLGKGSQELLDLDSILGRIHANPTMGSDNDAYWNAVLEGAKLFQFFTLLQRGGCEANQISQHFPAVSIDTKVQ